MVPRELSTFQPTFPRELSSLQRSKSAIRLNINIAARWKKQLRDDRIGHAIDSGIDLSIKIDKLRVFINKTLSILSAYQQELINRRCLSTVG
jgi:hypothetical protein